MTGAALGGAGVRAATTSRRRGQSSSDNGTEFVMRVSLATMSADRISHSAILVAGVLCGVLVFFVAMPLALSSPFPSPKDEEWIVRRSSLQAALPMPVPDAIEEPRALEPEASADSWSLASLPPKEAPSGFVPEETAEPESTRSLPEASAVPEVPARPKRAVGIMQEVDDYIREVYQRAPVKKDGAGDFTWKDPAAAKRMGMPM